MAPDKDFSLISVSSDEEDDIVIQAGVASATAAKVSEEAAESGQPEAKGRSNDIGSESALEVPDETAFEHEDAPVAKVQRKTASANSMLTSEDDLHAPVPYEGMQRIILIVFALLLVVAVAYWVLIRPTSG